MKPYYDRSSRENPDEFETVIDAFLYSRRSGEKVWAHVRGDIAGIWEIYPGGRRIFHRWTAQELGQIK